MSKLWIEGKINRLDEAVKRLNKALHKQMGQEDVIKLAIDGCLTLSVEFVYTTDACAGFLVPKQEEEKYSNEYRLAFSDNQLLIIPDNLASISGVWDICPEGAGISNLQQLWRDQRRNPEVSVHERRGVILKREENGCVQYVQLQEHIIGIRYFENEALFTINIGSMNYTPRCRFLSSMWNQRHAARSISRISGID